MGKCVIGINDLATTHPMIAAEWNYEKNGILTPDQVMAGSGKRVWWKCEIGHEWKTAVYHRKAGHNCPRCSSRKTMVHKGLNDLLTLNSDISSEWDYELNKPLKPEDVTLYSQVKVWWKCKDGHSWKTTVSKRAQGQRCPVCTGVKVWSGFNDLATTHPDIAAEWNYEKNGSLTPDQVMAGADKTVWWRCKEGHEWQALIYSRKAGTNCPHCAGNTVTPGVNDLLTVRPDIAATWDYVRNPVDITPETVSVCSNRKFWWKCKSGHSWETQVYVRSKGCECPYCNKSVLLKGFNDLATKNPSLCKEWDHYKNKDVEPDSVTEFSKQIVWWRDELGHEWQASVANRSCGTGCPFCAGTRVLKGFNDLRTTNPKLAVEWYYEKNGELLPDDVTSFSNRRVWWRCDKDHWWESSIADRTNGNGCPYCSNRKAWPGYNDLESQYPEIAKEWNYDLNGDTVPAHVTYGSTKKFWWTCSNSHNFEQSVNDRTNGAGCPYCKNRAAYPGYNDLGTTATWLLKEWDYERNGDLKPDMVLPFSNRKVGWKCKAGHRWRCTIGSRQQGTSCPYCSGRFSYRKHLIP